jgi:hypothetical protein
MSIKFMIWRMNGFTIPVRRRIVFTNVWCEMSAFRHNFDATRSENHVHSLSQYTTARCQEGRFRRSGGVSGTFRLGRSYTILAWGSGDQRPQLCGGWWFHLGQRFARTHFSSAIDKKTPPLDPSIGRPSSRYTGNFEKHSFFLVFPAAQTFQNVTFPLPRFRQSI